MEEIDKAQYPDVLHANKLMHPVGRGKFPYDCVSRDKYPDAMIYHTADGSAWTHEYCHWFRDDLQKAREAQQPQWWWEVWLSGIDGHLCSGRTPEEALQRTLDVINIPYTAINSAQVAPFQPTNGQGEVIQ